MRVVQLLHTRQGGHVRYTAELCAALSRCPGVAEVHLVGAQGTESPVAGGHVVHGVLPGVDVDATGWRRIRDRVATYRAQHDAAVAWCEQHGIGRGDVVHLQELPTLGARRLVRLLRRRGAVVVLTVHNVEPHDRGPGARAVQRLLDGATREADLIVVHGDHLRRRLLEQAAGRRVTLPDVAVVPHPLWDVAAAPCRPERDYLLFGVLRENKGVLDYLRALRDLDDPPAGLVGHAEPAFRALVEQEVRHLGLRNLHARLEFVAERQVAGILAAHAVTVTPYTGFEAQSGVAHLAVALDRPVVATRVGALPELVGGFGVGELVGDDGLAAAMRRCLDRQRTDSYAAGFARARTDLGIDAIARRHHDCYRRLG